MSWTTSAAIYFIIWWLTLFLVLPWGVKRHEDSGEGHDAGAPEKSKIMLKMGINTVLAFGVWLVVYFIDQYDLIAFRDFEGD